MDFSSKSLLESPKTITAVVKNIDNAISEVEQYNLKFKTNMLNENSLEYRYILWPDTTKNAIKQDLRQNYFFDNNQEVQKDYLNKLADNYRTTFDIMNRFVYTHILFLTDFKLTHTNINHIKSIIGNKQYESLSFEKQSNLWETIKQYIAFPYYINDRTLHTIIKLVRKKPNLIMKEDDIGEINIPQYTIGMFK